MTGGHDPRDVLAAVRRLEAELEDIRSRARQATPAPAGLDELRRVLAADAARERREIVEDMEALVDLVGTAWRSTGEQIAAISHQLAALAVQVGEIRAMAEDARRAMRGARLELRLGGPGNGEGAPRYDRSAPA
ncbi:MAG: hypothetical protein AB1416_08540 [Actinomycetota bacterium]